jgi:hypothetical protein
MKRSLIIIVFLVFLSVIFIYFKYVYGWLEYKGNAETPKMYLNYSTPTKENYKKDSVGILKILKNKMEKHEGFFYSKEYFAKTKIIIDTIVYSPEFNKFAILVITKNPTYRQRLPQKHNWYYDATAYLGCRHNDTICLYWSGPTYTNSEKKEVQSGYIRNHCFNDFSRGGVLGEIAYNINDVRLWDCKFWEKIYTNE